MYVVFEGPFSEEDLRYLGAALCVIERRQPDKHFVMVAEHPDQSLAEARALLERVFPTLEGGSLEVRVIRRNK